MNLTCQRCKSRMTLLFTSAVCDVCNPPGSKVRPVVDISPFIESQGFDPSTFTISDRHGIFVTRDLIVILDTSVKDSIKVTYNKVRGVQSKVADAAWQPVDHIIWGELIWRGYNGSIMDENLVLMPNTTRMFAGTGKPR